MFTAYLLFRLFQLGWVGRILTVVLFFSLTISGLVDMTPIKNDFAVRIPDIERQPLAKWVKENTDVNDVFLTTFRIYNPISLAGRRNFQGWPYFSWSAGYDAMKRERLGRRIYETHSKEDLCSLLRENQINYILTEKQLNKDSPFKINHRFFNSNFEQVFFDQDSDHQERVFATKDICKN